MIERALDFVRKLPRPRWTLRSTVGIAASATELRAVGARGERVLWAMRAERTAGEPIDREITALLRATPAMRAWPRPRVVVAVPSSASQVKRLPNLPAAPDRVLDGIVREGCGRFFRKNGVPLDTGGTLRDGADVWAAAYERPLLADVERGCAVAGLSLHAAVPSIVAAAEASREPVIRWRDGTDALELERAPDRRWTSIRPLHHSPALEAPRVVAPLAVLGAEAWSYADAYGAAVGGAQHALALRIVRPQSVRTRATRLVVAGAVCAVAWVAAAIVPVARASHDAGRARRELARLAPARASYAQSAMGLELATRQLGDLARFDAERGRATLLMAQLAAALPPGSALVALRVDSAGGTLVGIAPQAAALVEALDKVPVIASPEIIGPITRDALPPVAGQGTPAGQAVEVERVTVRFRIVPLARRNR